jgi:hypothetical protein
MALLRPFRQYHENDVINLFAFDYHNDGAATRGLIVKMTKGWKHDEDLENVALSSYANTLSDRWSVAAVVRECGLTAGDSPVGMLLYDVAEVDENGEKLIFNPRKADEMQVALSGQAVPILTRGLVMVNGVEGHSTTAIDVGVKAYTAAAGAISTLSPTHSVQIGKFLGPQGTNGDVLLKLEL